jgi:hypothetical protein
MMVLPSRKNDGDCRIHEKGEALRNADGPAGALVRRVPPAKLRAPPEQARQIRGNGGAGLAPCLLKRLRHQNQFAAIPA